MSRLSPRARGRLGALALTGLAVAARWPFWREALRTPLDGDRSLVALMALHPLHTGSTLWGQPYGSPLGAWLLAPWLWLAGPRPATVSVYYFTLGLLLVPAAFLLARALQPGIEWHAAALAALPPAYMLLLSSAPPPLYALVLLLCAGLLAGSLTLERRLARGQPARAALLLWGVVAGLALWTHLMAASVVAAGLGFLSWRAGAPRVRLWPAFAGLLLGAAPLGHAFDWRVAAGSRARETFVEHLQDLLPALHRPVAGLLGGAAPLLCDDATHVIRAPVLVTLALAALAAWGLTCAWRPPRSPGVMLLMGCLAAALLVFVLPARSGPHTFRYLTPAFLPGLVLVARGAVSRLGPRRAWAFVALACALQLVCSVRLLRAWQTADRAAAPFLLPDLAPVRAFLEARGLHHAYAEYATAYRLTFESGERVVASPPWNERFRHHRLPLLDEVRASGRVAWLLRDTMASDLPTTRAFEAELAALDGRWRKAVLGDVAIYWGFEPPFGPRVVSPPGRGLAADGDLATFESRAPGQSLGLTLAPDQPAAALTLLAPPSGPGLPRAFALEVSRDGRGFETLDRRAPEDGRRRMCWLNGQPQFPADRDAYSLTLPAGRWRALRVVSLDPRERWAVAEVLLHPPAEQPPWLATAGEEPASPADRERADALFRRMLALRRASW